MIWCLMVGGRYNTSSFEFGFWSWMQRQHGVLFCCSFVGKKNETEDSRGYSYEGPTSLSVICD